MDGVHTVISPSYPSSSSSSNASSSPVTTLRGDGLPPYGSNVAVSVSTLPTDDELRCEGVEKLIQRFRTCELEHKKLLTERGRIMKDVNKRLQVHLIEVRSLREVNRKLQLEKDRLTSEKNELGGMCCFLDDDREKAKKMAQEWQVFGRYATGVLQKELSQCHIKIRDLEQKQQNLLFENRSLKELCLLLDQEQAGSRTSLDSQSSFHGPIPGLLGVAGTRDSGDGSSNGSTASNCSPDHRLSFQKENPATAEGRESYVRFLESKVRLLEDEVKGRLKKIPNTVPTHPQGFFNMSPGKSRIYPSPTMHSSSSTPSTMSNSSSSINTCIGNSLSVLDVNEQLDNTLPNSVYPGAPTDGNHLDEQHKKIVREMCNVVWRKLGDSRGTSGKPPPQNRPLQHRSASVSNL